MFNFKEKCVFRLNSERSFPNQILIVDNSGYITKEEMLEVVASGVSDGKADDPKAAIDELVVDKDGKVSYPE